MLEVDYNKFEPMNESSDSVVSEAMHYLRDIDLANCDLNLLGNKIGDLYHGLRKIGLIVPTGKTYERVVKNDHNTKPGFVSEVSYPPQGQSQDVRGWLGTEIIFFCSDDTTTALLEKDSKVGDVFFVGKWVSSSPISVVSLGLDQSNLLNLINYSADWSIDRFNELTKLVSDRDNAILKFIGELFLLPREGNNDKLISIIASRSYGDNSLNALAYPSVKNKFQGINYAIKSSFINDRKLILEEGYLVEIIETGEIVRFLILDYVNKINSDNSLNWVGLINKYVACSNENLFFAESNLGWCVYNELQDALPIY